MKRPASDRPIKRTGNVRKDLSENQLAWIGSVALAYNETEALLDLTVTCSLGQLDLGHELTSRINGTDGKIEIIKTAMEKLKAEQSIRDAIALTLGADGFAGLKKYRDRIIHARIRDAKNAIAESPASRGKFEEVLLIPKALGRVDGFDQDKAKSKRDERTVILRRLLASKRDTLEALELADRLFDACPRLVECFWKESGHVFGVGSIWDCRAYSALACGLAV